MLNLEHNLNSKFISNKSIIFLFFSWDRVFSIVSIDDGSNFAEIIRDCFAEGETGPDRKCESCLCRGNNSGATGKTERQETVSGRGNNVLESCPGPEVLLGCRVYDLSRRGCVSRVSPALSFFLSQPATTRFHHVSPCVISLSANGVWIFRSIERWLSKRAVDSSLQRCRAAYRAAAKGKRLVEVGHCCAGRFIFNVYYYLW